MFTRLSLLALLCAFSPNKVGGAPVPLAGLDACKLVLLLPICQCVRPVRCISLAISECVQATGTSGTFAGLLYSEWGRTPCSRPSTEQSRVRESLSGLQPAPFLPSGFPSYHSHSVPFKIPFNNCSVVRPFVPTWLSLDFSAGLLARCTCGCVARLVNPGWRIDCAGQDQQLVIRCLQASRKAGATQQEHVTCRITLVWCGDGARLIT